MKYNYNTIDNNLQIRLFSNETNPHPDASTNINYKHHI